MAICIVGLAASPVSRSTLVSHKAARGLTHVAQCFDFRRQVGYLHERLIYLEKSEVDSEAKVPSDVSLRCGK